MYQTNFTYTGYAIGNIHVLRFIGIFSPEKEEVKTGWEN
jgi:hypothetical protein